jgi:hypothetical protein
VPFPTVNRRNTAIGVVRPRTVHARVGIFNTICAQILDVGIEWAEGERLAWERWCRACLDRSLSMPVGVG